MDMLRLKPLTHKQVITIIYVCVDVLISPMKTEIKTEVGD